MKAWYTVAILSELQQEPQQDLTSEQPTMIPAEQPSTIPVPTSIPLPQVLLKKNMKKARDKDAPDGSCSDTSTATFSEQVSNTDDGNSDHDKTGIRTTVMLRNMPNNYSRTMLLELLDAEGFAGQYDFLYLPMDFQSRASLGYAFINFVDPVYIVPF